MNIALIGYGKMGKEIEKILLSREHEIVARIDASNSEWEKSEEFLSANVAIEFTSPESAFENIHKSLSSKVPVVSGTTGWLDKVSQIEGICHENESAFLYASNFSIGVNIFFALNEHLAKVMNKHNEYTISIEEVHHITKKDAPSGTAITLAEGIIDQHSEYENWGNHESKKNLSITSKRIDQAPGTHIIKYSSEIDEIVISHEAKSRKGFALGAVLAAEYIHDKKGIFTMKEVLGF